MSMSKYRVVIKTFFEYHYKPQACGNCGSKKTKKEPSNPKVNEQNHRRINLDREAKPRKWSLEGTLKDNPGNGIWKGRRISFGKLLKINLKSKWPAPSTRAKPRKWSLEGPKPAQWVSVHI